MSENDRIQCKATIQQAIQGLLIQEAEVRPDEVNKYLLEIKDYLHPELRPMFTSCLKYLQGFEVVDDMPATRTIVILSNKRSTRSSTIMRRVLALDLQTGSIITLASSPEEDEIPVDKIGQLAKGEVVKAMLKKIRHKKHADVYLVSSRQDIVSLGRIDRLLTLFDKCSRYHKGLNVYFDRSDYDKYIADSPNWSPSSQDYYPISSFDDVLSGVFEVKQKKVRHFLVNFTGSQIRPHKQYYQIKMRNCFVNIDVSNRDNGKFFKGVALLRCYTDKNGRDIYFAEELFGDTGTAEEIKAWSKNSNGNLDFDSNNTDADNEEDFGDEIEDDFMWREDEFESDFDGEFDKLAEIEDDESDSEMFDDEVERMQNWRNRMIDREEEEEERQHQRQEDLERTYSESFTELLNQAKVYEASDVTRDNFAFNYNKIPYKQYREKI